MSDYDNYRCGGSDPGYDPIQTDDPPEPFDHDRPAPRYVMGQHVLYRGTRGLHCGVIVGVEWREMPLKGGSWWSYNVIPDSGYDETMPMWESAVRQLV